jgi:hypothetical protein
LAAAFHPKFRLIWLHKYDKSQVPRVKKAMETAVAERLQQNAISLDGSTYSTVSSNDDDDDFFSDITKSDNIIARRNQRLVHSFSDWKIVKLPRNIVIFGCFFDNLISTLS